MHRTQVYLSEAQRRSLDRMARREGVSLAEIVRRAVDGYLDRAGPGADRGELMERTFGALPHLEVPARSEWKRRGGRSAPGH